VANKCAQPPIIKGNFGLAILLLIVAPFCGGVEPTAKVALPTPAEQQAADKLVSDAFGDDITAAKTVIEKKALARKLMQASVDEKKDSAGRYALLLLTNNTWAEAGDFDDASQAVDLIDKSYVIDALKMKADAAILAAKSIRTVDDRKEFVTQLTPIIEQGVSADRYEVATQLCDLAMSSARMASDTGLQKQVVEEVQRVRECDSAYTEIKKARVKLGQQPTDPDANLTVAKFECFIKGDWATGLPMLVLGSDVTLKGMAQQDLAEPTSGDDQAKLGDAWWETAEKLTGKSKVTVQRHAADWYNRALPSSEGLVKRKIQLRLKAVATSMAGRTVKPVDQWILLTGTIDDYNKYWIAGDDRGTVTYDPDKHFIHVSSPRELGGFVLKQPWKECSFRLHLDGLSFGNLRVALGKTALNLGDALHKHLPFEGLVEIKFDDQKQMLYAVVNGQRISEATVVDSSWNKKFSCKFSSDGGGTAKLYFDDFKVRVK